ncbi:hypothetical protein [Streptomyces sp. NPDC050548]|uniref:hypothetical protein n=1 Tax=Streptomyces sp. NPDC050548 TaxID=3365629 RepID=UPI0037A9CABB
MSLAFGHARHRVPGSCPAEAATRASAKFGYAAPLDGLVPKSVRSGFNPVSLDTCTSGGKAYCLLNDIAPPSRGTTRS